LKILLDLHAKVCLPEMLLICATWSDNDETGVNKVQVERPQV
jgi:hypothetical protein